jgi:hypothetical protein
MRISGRMTRNHQTPSVTLNANLNMDLKKWLTIIKRHWLLISRLSMRRIERNSDDKELAKW